MILTCEPHLKLPLLVEIHNRLDHIKNTIVKPDKNQRTPGGGWTAILLGAPVALCQTPKVVT